MRWADLGLCTCPQNPFPHSRFMSKIWFLKDRSKAVVPVLVLLFVALWFSLLGDLFSVLCYFVLVFSVLLASRLPRLGKRELICVLFVRLFDFVCFVLSISSSSWCLGRAAACNYGTPWTFLLPFFFICGVFFFVIVCSPSLLLFGRLCFLTVAFPGNRHLYFEVFREPRCRF